MNRDNEGKWYFEFSMPPISRTRMFVNGEETMIHSNGRSVNVRRVELLEILKTNREKHTLDYKEALEGYKVKLAADLEAALTFVKASSPEDVAKSKPLVSFAPPHSYESEYTDIIDMLEMSVDEVISLDTTSFKNYVKDEWHWKNSFEVLNSSYKSYASLSGAK